MHKIRFGADGIRGLAGEWPLQPDAFRQLGRAIGHYLRRQSSHPFIVLGRDTRPSGVELSVELKAGLLSQGIHVLDIGIMTTPGVAYLVRRQDADLGVIITASHSPVQYNGIKLVGPRGLRLQREDELQIESLLMTYSSSQTSPEVISGQLAKGPHLAELYIGDHVEKSLVKSLSGLQLVLDCSNGAISCVAPAVFERLDASVAVIHNAISGDGVNKECGSEHARQHPEALVDHVRQLSADYGLAFDGDGDRLVIVDKEGGYYNGDDILFVLATYFHAQGKLARNSIVTTHIANTGLKESLRRFGIQTICTRNGDKYLEAEMWSGGYFLGGEQVGNIIINDGDHTAADPLYATLLLAGIVQSRRVALKQLVKGLRKRPQLLVTLLLKLTLPLDEMPALAAQKESSLQRLGAGSRILTWYSSTEAGQFKIMIEGSREGILEQVREEAEKLCRATQEDTATESAG